MSPALGVVVVRLLFVRLRGEKSWHGGHLPRCYEKPLALVNTWTMY